MILILYCPSLCSGEWMKIPMVMLDGNWTQNDKCFYYRTAILELSLIRDIFIYFKANLTTLLRGIEINIVFYTKSISSEKRMATTRTRICEGERGVRNAINIKDIWPIELYWVEWISHRYFNKYDIAACLLSSLSPMSNDSNFSPPPTRRRQYIF